MTDPEQIARGTRAENALRAALTEMRPAVTAETAAWVTDFLDHNELGVAMDTLLSSAIESEATELPEDAVKHLRVASAEMDNYRGDDWDDFVSRFG
jgi:hypothetical protein